MKFRTHYTGNVLDGEKGFGPSETDASQMETVSQLVRRMTGQFNLLNALHALHTEDYSQEVEEEDITDSDDFDLADAAIIRDEVNKIKQNELKSDSDVPPADTAEKTQEEPKTAKNEGDAE